MLQSFRRRWWPESVFLLIISIMAAWVVNVGRPEPMPWWGDYAAKKVEDTVRKGLAVIGPDEARAVLMNGKALFIDARDPDEFAAGHIPGAMNISADALMTGLEPVVTGLDKTKAMILYCGNLACSKSKDLAQGMKDLGFTNLAVMPEGMDGWRAVGGPVEAK